jgi:hypothetical protein
MASSPPADAKNPGPNGHTVEPVGSVELPLRTNGAAAPLEQALTGKEEHCMTTTFHPGRPERVNMLIDRFKDLKRELISEQVKWEISELNSPTALRRFGAPFKSDLGEISPLDSELPILRYIFVHHVREFPFLDKAMEKEFWQDKLQVVRFRSRFSAGNPLLKGG